MNWVRSFISIPVFPLGMVIGEAALQGLKITHVFKELKSSASSMPRWDQAWLKIESHYHILVWLLSHFPMGVSCRIYLNNLSWGILHIQLNQHSWYLSIWRSGSTFRSLGISKLLYFVVKCHTMNFLQKFYLFPFCSR